MHLYRTVTNRCVFFLSPSKKNDGMNQRPPDDTVRKFLKLYNKTLIKTDKLVSVNIQCDSILTEERAERIANNYEVVESCKSVQTYVYLDPS